MAMAHAGGHNTQVPETIPRTGIHVWNLISAVGLWAVLSVVFGIFSEKYYNEWAGFATVAIIGFMFLNGRVATTIPDWQAMVLFDPVFKTRRVLFQGFHWKVWWEQDREEGLVDLKRELHADDTPMILVTNDPAESMVVVPKIHLQIDTTGNPQRDAQNVINFASNDEKAITGLVRGEVGQMLQEYYENHEMEELSKTATIRKEVFEDNDANCRCIESLGERFGMHIGVVLESSVPTPETQDMKRTPARAEALRTAMDTLTKRGTSKLTPEQARRAALNLDPHAEFTETHTDWKVALDATGLENLHDVQIFPPGTLGGGGNQRNNAGNRGNNPRRGGRE
jgi:hypothetical protein